MGNTLKNYSKEGQKLPLFGIGPYLIYGIAFLNAVVIVLTSYVFKIGVLENSWVWNPMYTGWWFIIIGISFMWHNYWLVPMIIVDWIILIVVLKNTEEKWLFNVFGEEYITYKSHVNRLIPWMPKKK